MSTSERPEELRTKVFGERTIYDNPRVRLTLVDIEPPDGRRFEDHVVRLQRVAVALVLNEGDEVLMMWRHRFVDDSWGWEPPGGIWTRMKTVRRQRPVRSKRKPVGVLGRWSTR